MIYTPDRWIVITLINDMDKVLAGWNGGYLDSSYWKLNSGNKKVEEFADHFLFHGQSGSIYKCYKNRYGLTSLTSEVLNSISKDKILLTNKYEV